MVLLTVTKQTPKKRNGIGQPPGPRQRSGAARPFILQRIRRRDLILLLGLLSLACVAVFGVASLILRAQPGPAAGSNPAAAGVGSGLNGRPVPAPTHTVTFVEVSGLNQFGLAQAAAKAWAADAELVTASATWPQVFRMDQIGAPAQWTYRFYSPARARLYFVQVTPEGGVESFEHPVKVTLPPKTIPTGAWLIDSPAALATWLDWDGAKLVQTNPGFELVIQLRMTNDSPHPVWVVVGADDRTRTIRLVAIDANEGVVVVASPENEL